MKELKSELAGEPEEEIQPITSRLKGKNEKEGGLSAKELKRQKVKVDYEEKHFVRLKDIGRKRKNRNRINEDSDEYK